MAFWNRKKEVRADDSSSSADITKGYLAAIIGNGVNEVTGSDMAMKISTVYRCVDILSKGIAQLPLIIKRNRGDWLRLPTTTSSGLPTC